MANIYLLLLAGLLFPGFSYSSDTLDNLWMDLFKCHFGTFQFCYLQASCHCLTIDQAIYEEARYVLQSLPPLPPPPPLPACGNGSCDGGEDCSSCPTDCGVLCNVPITCGDGVCENDGGPTYGPEDWYNCPEDCWRCNEKGWCTACMDGWCAFGETVISCPVDCLWELPTTCGDGWCNASSGETPVTCPLDCGILGCNYNGACDLDETLITCPADCPTVCSDSNPIACGAACVDCTFYPGLGSACVNGQCQCPLGSSSCLNPLTMVYSCPAYEVDPVNCGYCNHECPPGFACYDGICVDPNTQACTDYDSTHCGSSCVDCTQTVGVGAVCNGGVCSCPPETTSCRDSLTGVRFCTAPRADPRNCGGCSALGSVPQGENCLDKQEVCYLGNCGVTACTSNANCSTLGVNYKCCGTAGTSVKACTNVNSNASVLNCGACGNTCGSGGNAGRPFCCPSGGTYA